MEKEERGGEEEEEMDNCCYPKNTQLSPPMHSTKNTDG